MRKGEPYTEAENAFIRRHWEEMDDHTLARHLLRTEQAIGSHRIKLGLIRDHKGKKSPTMRPWSAQDDRQLADLYREGKSDREIAQSINRTPGAVGQRRSSIRLVKPHPPDKKRQHPLWTAAQDRELRRLFHEGNTDQRIGELMGKTATAIKDRRQTLDLCRKKRTQ